MPLVSIVVPVLRDTGPLERTLEALDGHAGHRHSSSPSGGYEVIVANGDATDESLLPLRVRYPAVRWTESDPGRGIQMNAGAALAVGRWLLFLHADTRLDPSWYQEMERVDRDGESVVGGAFAFRIQHQGLRARILELGVALRVHLCGLPYGDQGVFVRREVFEGLGGYASIPIMEDIDLVRRLRREGLMVWSPVPIEVSARRWERDGWVRRSVLNMLLVGLFFAGVSPQRLSRRYYGQGTDPVSWPVADGVLHEGDSGVGEGIVVIIPALNEQAAIVAVLDDVPEIVQSVTVVDNGSTDDTASRAREHGAEVVVEPRKGYGRACLAGMKAHPEAGVVVFLDADRSDYPAEMTKILAPILSGDADFVLGCRDGVGRPATARVGTWLCLALINGLWQTDYRDLGPFRAIRRLSLDRLLMVDETWGWTIEMQVKAAEAGLRVVEVPVSQRPRIGQSKISGTVLGTLRAGTRMLATIWSLWRTRHLRSYS